MNRTRRTLCVWICWIACGACGQLSGCAWNAALSPLGGPLGGGAAANVSNGGIFGGNLPATPNYGIPLVQAGGNR